MFDSRSDLLVSSHLSTPPGTGLSVTTTCRIFCKDVAKIFFCASPCKDQTVLPAELVCYLLVQYLSPSLFIFLPGNGACCKIENLSNRKKRDTDPVLEGQRESSRPITFNRNCSIRNMDAVLEAQRDVHAQ
jgi:hypothetical protein